MIRCLRQTRDNREHIFNDIRSFVSFYFISVRTVGMLFLHSLFAIFCKMHFTKELSVQKHLPYVDPIEATGLSLVVCEWIV